MCSVAGDGCPAGWLHPNDGSTSRRQGDARTPNRPGITSRRTARMRRGGRVVEGARLESVFTGDRNAGSNPALSARLSRSHLFLLYFSEHPDNHPTHYPTLFQDCTGSLRTSQFNLERIARENRKTALRLISAAEISFAVARKRTLPAPSLKVADHRPGSRRGFFASKLSVPPADTMQDFRFLSTCCGRMNFSSGPCLGSTCARERDACLESGLAAWARRPERQRATHAVCDGRDDGQADTVPAARRAAALEAVR